MRFRVVTWNIHKGIGGVDRRYRIERVISLLAEIRPDVALLQEVAADMPRALGDDQIHVLAHELGMRHFAYSPQHRFTRGGYGNAVLSHWPLYDVHHVDLTIGTRKRRGALQAKARLRIGRHARSIVLCNMHLGLAGSERGLQLERFLAAHPFRGLHQRTPIILGGDLNDVWGTLGPRFLQPAGFSRAGSLVPTFPAWLPVRPLDGIFVRGDAHTVQAGSIRAKLARAASDHLPLVADLSLTALSR
jgi:endonuclease/exonuclease/phosphatase family metal-dependent hydrolase